MSLAQDGESRWIGRRAMVVGQSVVFYSCLVLFIFLLSRLPVEDAQASVKRFTATRLPPTATCERVAGQSEDIRELACLRDDMAEHVADGKRGRVRALWLVAILITIALAVTVQRRRDRERLAEQLRFSEQLIDAMPLPLSLRSPEGRFMLVNKAFESRYGIPRDKLLGRLVGECFTHDFADRVLEMDARAAASTQPEGGTFYIPTLQGMRHVQVCVLGIRRADGSLIGMVGVQNDVTDMVDKEAQLSEINAKLTQVSMKMIAAQEDERRRIARDLHDQVGQILTALKLQLSSLAKRERIDLPAAALLTGIDLTDEALMHTRNLSASLHPHLLDDLGLEPSLNWLVDRFIRPSLANVQVRCRLDPSRGPAAIELAAFRIVQEALTNVVRHAQATRAGVMLESRDGMLTIEVIDDGTGFDAGHTWFDLQRSSSVGMTSMHDRASEAGGDLHIDSSPGHGTSLRAHLPWPPPEERA